MSNFVRASLLALATIQSSNGVQAITLRTLLDNQLTAEADTSIEAYLNE